MVTSSRVTDDFTRFSNKSLRNGNYHHTVFKNSGWRRKSSTPKVNPLFSVVAENTGILPLSSQCILSLMLFVVKNKYFFISNSENHSKGTRQLNNLHHPITNLTVHQKGAHYMGIRIFNNLPLTWKRYLIIPRNLKIV